MVLVSTNYAARYQQFKIRRDHRRLLALHYLVKPELTPGKRAELTSLMSLLKPKERYWYENEAGVPPETIPYHPRASTSTT